MRGSPAVALAVLLALAPAVVAVPAGHTAGHAPATTPAPVVPEANTTEYLALPSGDIQTEGFGTVTIDVSSALAADAGRLDAAFTRRQLSEAVDAAETDADRRLVVRLAADRVATRADSLRAREREVLEAYNAGELSAREYLGELAVIDARAEALRDVVSQLRDEVERVENPPVTERQLDSFEAQLLPLRGPVRSRVGQVLAGERDESLRVYVETSSAGVVLAMVVDGNYVREAYLASGREPGATDQFRESDRYHLDAAESRFLELYPWTANNSPSRSVGNTQLDGASVYPVTAIHPHGQLTTYLDGGTTDAFLEHQRKDLSGTPTDVSVTNAADGLRLRVNRTHVGGPLEVRVEDNATGEPVDARITVDDEPIGRTGADGRLWTIAPPARFTVNATDAGRRVSVDTFSRREP